MTQLEEATKILNDAGYDVYSTQRSFNSWHKNSLRSFIAEKADEAYNIQMSNLICRRIKDLMPDIYMPTIEGKYSSKVRLTRRGQGGAYQLDIKINSDGTFSAVDNSNAYGCRRELKDGSTKFILFNAETYYTTKKTNQNGVDEMVEWLIDNYDSIDPINQKAIDRKNGINRAAIGTRDPLKRKKGQAKRTTEISRSTGITSIADFLAKGGKISDLINK